MDRTVPSSGNEEIKLYMRTYYSLLRSSHAVQIKTLREAHKRMRSALHIKADSPTPDMSAFIYGILRMPACLWQVKQVIMGQSESVFAKHDYPVESWELVSAPGRRRRSFFDGDEILALYIASGSDIDDIVPILTAYQIERGKLHDLLNKKKAIALLRGLRVISDFEFELTMAINNHKLAPEIETVNLMPSEPYLFLSSRLVKEIAACGGSLTHFVSPSVERRLHEKFETE